MFYWTPLSNRMEEWEPVGGWNASFSEQDRIQSTNLFFFFKKRIIHFAFSGSNDQFELLIKAADAVLAGIVIVKVVVDVLSDPKSSTAIDLLPCVTL